MYPGHCCAPVGGRRESDGFPSTAQLSAAVLTLSLPTGFKMLDTTP